MGVPNLSDGYPLTYEWLNQVADAINKLDASNQDDSNVKFAGYVSGDDILVVTGSVDISVGANATRSVIRQNNIAFPVSFADNKVTVIAMVTSIAAKQDAEPVAAGVAIGEVTSTNFDAIIQLFADGARFGKKKLQLRYVAIGKKQS